MQTTVSINRLRRDRLDSARTQRTRGSSALSSECWNFSYHFDISLTKLSVSWFGKFLIGLSVAAACLLAWWAWSIATEVPAPIAAPQPAEVTPPSTEPRPVAEMKSHLLYLPADRMGPLYPQFWVVLPQTSATPAGPVISPESGETKTLPKPHGYLGAAACAECHRDYFDTYQKTAHFRSSQLPDLKTVLGKFDPDHNTVAGRRANLRLQMESLPDGLYQRVDVRDRGQSYTHSERFDIVTGSGSRGQSYLYWKQGGLYQLPVSYLTARNQWVNSPGYLEGTANFSRAIQARCLECHATYFEHVPNTVNRFRSDNFILGISCERCHGPGSEHVAFHRSHPGEKVGQHIVQPGSLPVERRHDVCRQCHSRSGASLQEPFTFKPGEVLSKYLDLALDDEVAPGAGGIHTANQFARLKMSKCLQKSPELSCNDCHNLHREEHGQIAVFSERCQKCHQASRCGMSKTLGKKIEKNCIDCHMAWRNDASINITTVKGNVSNATRDHAITIDKALAERLVNQGLFEEKNSGKSPSP